MRVRSREFRARELTRDTKKPGSIVEDCLKTLVDSSPHLGVHGGDQLTCGASCYLNLEVSLFTELSRSRDRAPLN